MKIYLSNDHEQFVHDAVLTCRYATEDDVVNDALARLKQALPENAAISGKTAKPGPSRKKPLTEAEFDQQLLALGLISQLPDTDADFDDPDDQLIEIKGEPLSETIIRECR